MTELWPLGIREHYDYASVAGDTALRALAERVGVELS
jgi:hypothetical protein